MAYIKIDIDQGTELWDSFRRSHIGSSECACICGVDPYKKPKKLWEQKFSGEKSWLSPAMQRGKRLEPIARQMLEKANGISYIPIVAKSSHFDWMIASLDGWNEEKCVGIEIKCPNEKTFNQIILDRKIPLHYIYQIQHQMYVMECSKWLLIPFNGMYFEEIEVDRDEAIIQELLAKESRFYESMINLEYRNEEECVSK